MRLDESLEPLVPCNGVWADGGSAEASNRVVPRPCRGRREVIVQLKVAGSQIGELDVEMRDMMERGEPVVACGAGLDPYSIRRPLG